MNCDLYLVCSQDYGILNNMKKPIFKYTKIVSGIALLTAILLWTHIWIQQFSSPILSQLENGLQYPSPEQYNFAFMLAVYFTAIISTALIVFLYYHCGHLLNVKNKVLKSLVLACILLEVKQDLIRRPVMNLIMHYQVGSKNALEITLLRSLDIWLPAVIFAFILVYFCKNKKTNPNNIG